MMNGGWINFCVMDAFLKMFSCHQHNLDRFKQRVDGQIRHQYFDNSISVNHFFQ
uniref:Uncharacterized protein n=1 Tax=Arundo donax TaxID=35708 RepID=A0A0A9BHR7_ARUDO